MVWKDVCGIGTCRSIPAARCGSWHYFQPDSLLSSCWVLGDSGPWFWHTQTFSSKFQRQLSLTDTEHSGSMIQGTTVWWPERKEGRKEGGKEGEKEEEERKEEKRKDKEKSPDRKSVV